MTVITGAPMPLPSVRLGAAATTGQSAVTTPSATSLQTARPTYLAPAAFGPSVIYGGRDLSGQGLGRAGRTRYAGRSAAAASRTGTPPGQTVRPTYLMPHAFAPSVLYGARNFFGQGMGRYGRRVRLAGIERFAPSVLYGAYTVQAQGMGRYRPLNRALPGRMGCCGAPSRYGGYPVKRLGQNIFSDIGSLFTPTPGGGSVTVDGQTQYVNAQGVDQSTVDPAAGQSLMTNPGAVLGYDASGLATAAASGLASSIPWWGWGLLVLGGGALAYKVLK